MRVCGHHREAATAAPLRADPESGNSLSSSCTPQRVHLRPPASQACSGCSDAHHVWGWHAVEAPRLVGSEGYSPPQWSVRLTPEARTLFWGCSSAPPAHAQLAAEVCRGQQVAHRPGVAAAALVLKAELSQDLPGQCHGLQGHHFRRLPPAVAPGCTAAVPVREPPARVKGIPRGGCRESGTVTWQYTRTTRSPLPRRGEAGHPRLPWSRVA
jgi:hypothetical protein